MSGMHMVIRNLGIVTPRGEFCLYCDFLTYKLNEEKTGLYHYGCSAAVCKKLP